MWPWWIKDLQEPKGKDSLLSLDFQLHDVPIHFFLVPQYKSVRQKNSSSYESADFQSFCF